MSAAKDSGLRDQVGGAFLDDDNSNDGVGIQQAGPSKSGEGKGVGPEKTISCVSCRKRKLKCDRIKPKCGTCSRLRHECEYPERRRTLGSKRRNMKELEARLAQVETQLVNEQKSGNAQPASATSMNMDADWNTLAMDMDLNFDTSNADFDIPQPGLPNDNSMPSGDFFSQELLALGLLEPLPPQDMTDELFEIYFQKFHVTMPMMHKLRFYTSLDLSPQKRPPICLRYAMWTMAASLTEKYTCIEDVLYGRARRYIEIEEMKGRGEAFITIYHAQTWGLIASYEAKKTYFSRSWMSTGRMIRMVHMLGLYRLDVDKAGVKTILPPARDWIDLEERRRTFWVAFYGDRWASSGTGWPMIIQENEIQTNLPCSEYAFENGIEESSISLAEALTPEGAPKISTFGGVIISATLFGHNFQHLHQSGPNENPKDLQNGEFWKRHRRMDNVLSNTFMFLPDQLRLPYGVRSMNVVFIHMNIHSSVICLHQAAVLTAERHRIDPNVIQQSHARCLMAAEEIANIMRLVCHVDPSDMHGWVGFCLYVAGGVFVKDLKSARPSQQSLTNLDFLLAAMSSISRQHSVTKHFIAQLDVDIEAAGLRNRGLQLSETPAIPNAPINGLLAARDGLPMTYHELQGYAGIASPPEGEYGSGESRESRQASSSGSNIALTPLSGIMANDSSGSSPDPPRASISTWDTRTTSTYVPQSCTDPDRVAKSGNDPLCGGKHDVSNPAGMRPSVTGINAVGQKPGPPLVMREQKASGYKAAASGLMQFPIREATPTTPGRQESTTVTKGIFCLPDGNTSSFSGPGEEFAATAGMWSNFDGSAQQQASIDEFNDFLFENSWNTNQGEG